MSNALHLAFQYLNSEEDYLKLLDLSFNTLYYGMQDTLDLMLP
jgi:hypothetical protein